MKKIITQFIPIVIIFLLLSYSNELAIFSHSILGKLISILIIGYYTIIDKYVGLFVCVLFIFYYQTDYVESMLNMFPDWDWEVNHDLTGDYKFLESFSELKPGCNCGSPKPIQESKKECKLNDEEMILKGYENFENYKELYQDNGDSSNEVVKDTFRKENCSSKGMLQYKNMDVKNDMAEIIFPELKFKDHVCNPCSKICDFSIIESRIKTEDELKPINTKYL